MIKTASPSISQEQKASSAEAPTIGGELRAEVKEQAVIEIARKLGLNIQAGGSSQVNRVQGSLDELLASGPSTSEPTHAGLLRQLRNSSNN